MPAGADSSLVPAAAYWGKTLGIVVVDIEAAVDTETGSFPQAAVGTGADNWHPKAAGNWVGSSPQMAGTVWADTDWDRHMDCMDFDRS